jgi:squalene-hopene/tetraprenyl-beta-curcumene cyclase
MAFPANASVAARLLEAAGLLRVVAKLWTFSLLLLLPSIFFLQGCEPVHSDSPPQVKSVSDLDRMDRGLAAAAQFLIEHQDTDGAWRSDTYGVFKDGPSLTPLVLETLLGLPPTEKSEAACRKGAAYLARMVGPDGSINEGPHGLSYPVYTAVFSVRALSRPQMADFRPARDAWLRFLRQRQLTEDLGWQPADKQYGGWGYSSQIPGKPRLGEPIQPLTESNLSATTFALEALQAAGCSPDDPAFKKALIFVQRCQNFSEEVSQADASYDDGGFFFIYDDAVRNKAGAAGKDRNCRVRFSSYGSTTADGVRCLLACGLSLNHPRVQASRTWLENNFRPSVHPGKYGPDREMNRQAVYFYYSLSVAKAFHSLGDKEIEAGNGRLNWASALTEDLLKRQQSDGSWINSAVAVREDDPVVATCLATQALIACRFEILSHAAAGASGETD